MYFLRYLTFEPALTMFFPCQGFGHAGDRLAAAIGNPHQGGCGRCHTRSLDQFAFLNFELNSGSAVCTPRAASHKNTLDSWLVSGHGLPTCVA